MSFILPALVLSTLAALAALWPLLSRKAQASHGGEDADRAEAEALRAALAENEADRENGRIGGEEAASARAELGRRLIALERGIEGRGNRATTGRPRVAVPVAVALLVPLASLGLYAMISEPLPPRVVAGPAPADEAAAGGPRRIVPTPPSANEGPSREERIRAMVAEAERALAENPGDAEGWLAVAPAYLALGEVEKGREAYERALPDLTGAKRSLVLAELVDIDTSGEGGPARMGAESLARLDEALALDPANAKAGVLRAMQVEGTGDTADALAAWRALVDLHADDAPDWLPSAQRRIRVLQARLRGLPEALAGLSPTERERVEGMVASLAARLEDEPGDGAGWERLAVSYGVLGRRDDALEALARATAIVALSDAADEDAARERDAALRRLTALRDRLIESPGTAPADAVQGAGDAEGVQEDAASTDGAGSD